MNESARRRIDMSVYTPGPLTPARTEQLCPDCGQRLLFAALKRGSGTLFPWCKYCKQEVAIKI